MQKPQNTLSSWNVFVLRHQKTPNIIFHVISCLLFWLSVPVAFLIKQPYLAAGFFLSGLVGTLGHFLFKDGSVNRREATSSLQVVHYSTKMVVMFLAGRYQTQILEAKVKFQSYLAGEISSDCSKAEIAEKLGEDSFYEQKSHAAL